jgi:hypothetical protein
VKSWQTSSMTCFVEEGKRRSIAYLSAVSYATAGHALWGESSLKVRHSLEKGLMRKYDTLCEEGLESKAYPGGGTQLSMLEGSCLIT